MAHWGHCDFSQYRELANSFGKLSDAELDDLCIACSKELASRLLALVIPATPVGKYPKGSGKKAAQGYAQSLTVTKSGNMYTVEIINPVEYASYVEFGHRTPFGGWVEGQYMLTISEEKLKRIAPSVLEKMVLQKLKEVCNGGN